MRDMQTRGGAWRFANEQRGDAFVDKSLGILWVVERDQKGNEFAKDVGNLEPSKGTHPRSWHGGSPCGACEKEGDA